MAKWSIRNYNAFIRAARKKSDLTQGQAKTVYRQMSQRLGRSLHGVDVKNRPRIFAASARIATGAARRVARVSLGGGGVKVTPKAAPGGGRRIESIRQFERYAEDFDFDAGYDEYESSADYGEV